MSLGQRTTYRPRLPTAAAPHLLFISPRLLRHLSVSRAPSSLRAADPQKPSRPAFPQAFSPRPSLGAHPNNAAGRTGAAAPPNPPPNWIASVPLCPPSAFRSCESARAALSDPPPVSARPLACAWVRPPGHHPQYPYASEPFSPGRPSRFQPPSTLWLLPARRTSQLHCLPATSHTRQPTHPPIITPCSVAASLPPASPGTRLPTHPPIIIRPTHHHPCASHSKHPRPPITPHHSYGCRQPRSLFLVPPRPTSTGFCKVAPMTLNASRCALATREAGGARIQQAPPAWAPAAPLLPSRSPRRAATLCTPHHSASGSGNGRRSNWQQLARTAGGRRQLGRLEGALNTGVMHSGSRMRWNGRVQGWFWPQATVWPGYSK